MQGLVGGVRPMVGRVRVFLLACAWVLLSHGNRVPLHFSFPLADEVLFGNNIRIVWRYDVRCACELSPPAESKAADSSSADPFIYFVQAGAYRSNDEAQAQRAKTSLLGLDAKISERDQGGRTVYRVRVGPIDKAEAERVRAKLEAAHIDSAMVRVQR